MLRGVMIDGQPLAMLGSQLAILAVWGLASFGVALRIFRWR
jgi:ABC-2 type transport system permease protein